MREFSRNSTNFRRIYPVKSIASDEFSRESLWSEYSFRGNLGLKFLSKWCKVSLLRYLLKRYYCEIQSTEKQQEAVQWAPNAIRRFSRPESSSARRCSLPDFWWFASSLLLNFLIKFHFPSECFRDVLENLFWLTSLSDLQVLLTCAWWFRLNLFWSYSLRLRWCGWLSPLEIAENRNAFVALDR